MSYWEDMGPVRKLSHLCFWMSCLSCRDDDNNCKCCHFGYIILWILFWPILLPIFAVMYIFDTCLTLFADRCNCCHKNDNRVDAVWKKNWKPLRSVTTQTPEIWLFSCVSDANSLLMSDFSNSQSNNACAYNKLYWNITLCTLFPLITRSDPTLLSSFFTLSQAKLSLGRISESRRSSISTPINRRWYNLSYSFWFWVDLFLR